jgi:hypothetical protein
MANALFYWNIYLKIFRAGTNARLNKKNKISDCLLVVMAVQSGKFNLKNYEILINLECCDCYLTKLRLLKLYANLKKEISL